MSTPEDEVEGPETVELPEEEPTIEPEATEGTASEEDAVVEPEDSGTEARAPTAAELRAFERENTRHEKKLGEIMGDDFAHFQACPDCGGVGFTPRPREEELALVKAAGVIECPTCAGEGGSDCVTCEGKGGIEYPTKVEGQRFQSCPACGGTGRTVCVDCAGNGWKREAAAAFEAPIPAGAASAQPGNGGGLVPPGYIVVQIDPNAPPLPSPPPAQAPSEPVAT